MRRTGLALVLGCVAIAAWFGASANPARASYTPTSAPYTQPVNDTPLTNLLGLPDAPPLGASRPTVPGFTYPSAWNDAADTMTKARIAGRFLPALETLGPIVLAAGALDLGWHIGTAANNYFHISGALTGYGGGSGSQQVTATSWRYTLGGLSTRFAASSGPGWVLWHTNGASGDNNVWALTSPVGTGTVDATGIAYAQAQSTFYPPLGGGSGCNISNVVGGQFSSNCGMVFKTPAEMSSSVRITPSDAAGYAASATQQNTSAYTPPTPTSTDRTNARAVLGNPVATRDTTTGVYKDASGNPLTTGQVQAQADVNCELDSSYCAGGANDPFAVGSPLATSFPMPDCAGLTTTACDSALAALGFTGTTTYTPLDLAGADVTKPGGAVVTQASAFGSIVPKTGTLTFTRNPTTMPVLLPQPLLNETYDQYMTRLATLGYVGVATVTDLSDLAAEPQLGPRAPVRIRVQTTTGLKELSPLAWPATPPRIAPDAPLDVVRNPASAPLQTTPMPTPTDTPPPAGGLDLSPLTSLDPGCKFPYGLFCYAKQVTNWFRVTPDAPDFTFHFPTLGGVTVPGGGTYDVNLGDVGSGTGSLDHYMGLWRDLLSVVLWVGAVWMLASRLLGLNLGDPGEAMDDA